MITFKNNGISHIESLHYKDFLFVLNNINEFNATEKLDGANLVFGFDRTGRFYTSRESKNGKRFFTVNDFENIPANNGFKSAHLALDIVSNELRPFVGDGNAIEVEILFGVQPNSIIYGKNYIAFLRPVPGDNNQMSISKTIQDIYCAFNEKSICVDSSVVTTNTGQLLHLKSERHTWFFTVPQRISVNLDNIQSDLEQFSNWLDSSSTIPEYTNAELLDVNLTKIPKPDRPKLKDARLENQQYADSTKGNIKRQIISSNLDDATPALRTINVPPAENFGIEGIVLQHKGSDLQVKIVNKEAFTTINGFYYAVRNKLKVTNLYRPQFDSINVPLENSDIFGLTLKTLSQALELPNLPYYCSIAKELKKYKQPTIEDTVDVLAKRSTIPFDKLKIEVSVDIQSSIITLINILKFYQTNYKRFTYTLQTGKIIKYSGATHDRTLVAFAELYEHLRDMFYQIIKAQNSNEIIEIMFKKQLNSLCQP